MRSKKFVVLLLVLCMAIASVPMYADVTPTDVTPTGVTEDVVTDGSISSAKWFQMFDSLIGADKYTNGLKFYMVLSSLRSTDLQNQVATVLDQDNARKTLLSNYDLNSGKIHQMMMFYFDTFPADMAQVLNDKNTPGNNIYSDIYHAGQLTYSDFMVAFYDYLNNQYSNLPGPMKYPISTWDARNQGEIHVFQNIFNILIQDYIFHIKRYNSGGLISQDMHLRPEMKASIVSELTRMGNAGSMTVNPDEVDDYADMFMALGDVMLESAELNLKTTGQLNNAIELGDKVGLVLTSRVADPEDPDPVIPTPTITLTPEFATVHLNPRDNESDEMDYFANVVDSTAGVDWSLSDDTVATIDEDGLVKLREDYERDINSPDTITVTATLKGNLAVSASATLQIIYNGPLGPVTFYSPYIKGYEDGSFKVARNVTRGEAAAMFTRVFSLDVKEIEGSKDLMYTKATLETPSFTDVSKDHWAYINVEVAKAEGLLDGYADNTFEVDEAMTRAEIAVLIYKALVNADITVDITAKHEITDVKKDHWAYKEINSVYNALIVNGYNDNSFRPDEFLNREQVVKMINSIIGRPEYLLPTDKFNDVAFGYWAFGDIISATMFQFEKADGTFELRDSITEE